MKPRFINHCKHSEEDFVGTVKVRGIGERKAQYVYYDVYVYPHKEHGHAICLRYGNDGPDYISDLRVWNLAGLLSDTIYIPVLLLLNKSGRFFYERR